MKQVLKERESRTFVMVLFVMGDPQDWGLPSEQTGEGVFGGPEALRKLHGLHPFLTNIQDESPQSLKLRLSG